MEMLNRAIEDASAFKDMMRKVAHGEAEAIKAVSQATPEVVAWNAEVDRKRAEKKARKAQHMKALNDLR